MEAFRIKLNYVATSIQVYYIFYETGNKFSNFCGILVVSKLKSVLGFHEIHSVCPIPSHAVESLILIHHCAIAL